ncbi:unnamed protein product [Dovyalis caffra]|uniref:Uncharacterized protein n=1 Tax=Dovyalis caffra TaxID=77055 RepID=A0AAV1R2B3_9ROSI|nr:unnamed protein product [Dovyalis caffra]
MEREIKLAKYRRDSSEKLQTPVLNKARNEIHKRGADNRKIPRRTILQANINKIVTVRSDNRNQEQREEEKEKERKM